MGVLAGSGSAGCPSPASVSSERVRTSSFVELGLVLLAASRGSGDSILISGLRRVIGSWKIMPEVGAAQPAQLLRRACRRGSRRRRAPRRPRSAAIGQQPEQATAERRLPAAGLADQAEHLARRRCRSETPSTARTGPRGRAVPDAQVADARRPVARRLITLRPRRLPRPRIPAHVDRLRRAARSTGLMVSLRPSPSSVRPVTSSDDRQARGRGPSTRSRTPRRRSPG